MALGKTKSAFPLLPRDLLCLQNVGYAPNVHVLTGTVTFLPNLRFKFGANLPIPIAPKLSMATRKMIITGLYPEEFGGTFKDRDVFVGDAGLVGMGFVGTGFAEEDPYEIVGFEECVGLETVLALDPGHEETWS